MAYTVEQQQVMALAAARKRQAEAQPAPAVPQPAAPIPPPAAPAPSPLSEGSADLQNLAQGLTWGWGDEASRAIKTHVFGEDPAQADQERTASNSSLQAWNDQNPTDALITQGIGGIASGGALAKMLKFVAPGAVNAVTKLAEKSPYLASAAAGGVQGAVYGAGAGEDGTRAESAATGAGGGALLGPALVGVARKVISPALNKAGSALEKFLKLNEGDAAGAAKPAPVAPSQPAAEPEISTMTNQPLGAPPGPEAGGPASLTGKLPLSPGVQARDPNLLRIEEAARQGNIGQGAQQQMQASDAGVSNAARAAMQQLKGVTNKDSDALLGDSVAQFQNQANTVKAAAQALYKQRDTLMADAVLNKNKVGPSLGKSLNDVVNDPTSVAGFKSKSGAPAKALYDDFLSLIKGTQGKELPFSDLAAWRADVANLATTDQSTAGTMAKRLGGAYDNWMDNLTQDHFIKGDPNVAAVARQAGSAWKNYKTLFGSENSPVISGMVKPYDATPADFVDKVFGANIAGNGNTALNMRKMVGALPPEAQAQFKNNVFSGLVSKVFEGANGDKLAIGKLRDNLQKFQTSQIYKEHFAADTEKNTVITNLVKDLSQHIQETGRRDVISPSGGAIMRGINGLLSIPAQIPLLNKLPLVKVPAELGAKAAELDQNFTDKKVFSSAMKKAAQSAHAAARSAPVFDLEALRAGNIGGSVSGGTVQINGNKSGDELDVKKKESKK